MTVKLNPSAAVPFHEATIWPYDLNNAILHFKPH